MTDAATDMRCALRAAGVSMLSAVLLWLAMFSPAMAQQKAPDAEPDPQRLAAAREIFNAQGGIDQARKSLEQTSRAIIEEARQSNPDIADGLARFLDKYFDPESPKIKKLFEEVIDSSARFYANRFTVEEMQALSGFLKSPIGQKFVAAAPDASAALAPKLLEFQRRLMIELQFAISRGELQKK